MMERMLIVVMSMVEQYSAAIKNHKNIVHILV